MSSKKIESVVNICDRCQEKFDLSGEIVENMTYTHSSYGRDSGGATRKGLSFCNSCSHSFNVWISNPDTVPLLCMGGKKNDN